MFSTDKRVKDVHFTEDIISVDLMDGRTITVPLVWYPRLLNASPEQLTQWEICGGGYGIHANWKNYLYLILPKKLTQP